MQWGSNPDTLIAWSTLVATIATAVAMVAAIIAGVAAVKTLYAMSKQTELAVKQTDSLRKQTETLVAQFDHAQAESAALEQLRVEEADRRRLHEAERILVRAFFANESVPSGGQQKLYLQIHNGSQVGIRQLRAAVVLGTMQQPKVVYAHGNITSIPPTLAGSPYQIEVTEGAQARWEEWCRVPTRTANLCPEVEFIFEDAHGAVWYRDYTGTYRELDAVCGHAASWEKRNGVQLCQC